MAAGWWSWLREVVALYRFAWRSEIVAVGLLPSLLVLPPPYFTSVLDVLPLSKGFDGPGRRPLCSIPLLPAAIVLNY